MTRTETAPVRTIRTMKSAVATHDPSSEEIAIRAHEIYVERGAEPGHDIEDWLQAERELSQNVNN